MHYALIDCENIAQFDISQINIPRHSNIVFCIGASQKHPAELIFVAECYGYQASSIKGITDGKNAMDFCLSAHLGHLAALNPDATFSIVSRDLGFEPLIDYLRSIDIRVSRITTPRPHNPGLAIRPIKDPRRRNLEHTIRQIEQLPPTARHIKRLADSRAQLEELIKQAETQNDLSGIKNTSAIPSTSSGSPKQTSLSSDAHRRRSKFTANALGLLPINVPRHPQGHLQNRELPFVALEGGEHQWDGVIDSQDALIKPMPAFKETLPAPILPGRPALSTQINCPAKPSMLSRLKDRMRQMRHSHS